MSDSINALLAIAECRHLMYEDQQALRDAAEELASLRLTDAEREAIAHAVQFYSQDLSSRWATIADTLRALLARLGGDA